MLPAYNKLRQAFDKGWALVPPPFERVGIPYEGQTLEGHFFPLKPAGGGRAPVVFAHGGADTFLHLGTDGGASEYRARGMAYLRVDTPGQGGSLRVKKLHAPPDTERVAKAVIDYLVGRADVDANRIGMTGASMGGYYAPRAASGEKRIKAVAAWSGCFSVLDDLYDYLPSIQDRLRWIVGAATLADARKKVAEFTMEGRAGRIECPVLLCYRIDDRVMDPRGCLKLHNAITRAPNNEMLEGFAPGHEFASGSVPRYDLRNYVADWMAKQLSA
jgi:dienelactone hydrolase